MISHSLDTRLFVVHWNVRLITCSLQCIFGSSQKQEVRKLRKNSCVSITVLKRDCWTVMKHFIWVCVSAVCMCVWVCVCARVCRVWAHITECWSLSIKGHTVTFHCEVFMILYDNAFLPNWLLQGMFYIISELCVHSWFLVSKWSFEENYVYCAFYWTVILTDFIPTGISKSLETYIFWIVFERLNVNWFPDRFRISCMQEFSICSQVLPWDYAVPRSA